jgi:Fe-Mn family superoxide dismutase
MPINFPDLPYPKDALEPYISARTMEFHHDKHHKAYVDNANKMLSGNPLEKEDIRTIIRKTANDPKTTGPIADKINSDFGSYEKFVEEFKNAATTQFGSGWAWLVIDGNKLKVMKTPNGENPIVHNMIPLLGLDIWEHSYYLDYQNRRADYVSAFIENLVNWDYVNTRLEEHQRQAQESRAHR